MLRWNDCLRAQDSSMPGRAAHYSDLRCRAARAEVTMHEVLVTGSRLGIVGMAKTRAGRVYASGYRSFGRYSIAGDGRLLSSTAFFAG